MPLSAQQKLRNFRTKARLIGDRIWRKEGWGVCTGDLEHAFIVQELDRLAGLTPEPLPDEVRRALRP
jgi:hypothetical protein